MSISPLVIFEVVTSNPAPLPQTPLLIADHSGTDASCKGRGTDERRGIIFDRLCDRATQPVRPIRLAERKTYAGASVWAAQTRYHGAVPDILTVNIILGRYRVHLR